MAQLIKGATSWKKLGTTEIVELPGPPMEQWWQNEPRYRPSCRDAAGNFLHGWISLEPFNYSTEALLAAQKWGATVLSFVKASPALWRDKVFMLPPFDVFWQKCLSLSPRELPRLHKRFTVLKNTSFCLFFCDSPATLVGHLSRINYGLWETNKRTWVAWCALGSHNLPTGQLILVETVCANWLPQWSFEDGKLN